MIPLADQLAQTKDIRGASAMGERHYESNHISVLINYSNEILSSI